MKSEGIPSNEFNSNDEFEAVKNKNMLENGQNNLHNEIHEKYYLENLLFPTIEDNIDNLPVKTHENASVVLFGNIEDVYNLLWNKSETYNMEIANISQDENEICQESDSNCFITKLLLVLAMIVIVLLVIAFFVFLFQERCWQRTRGGNQKLI